MMDTNHPAFEASLLSRDTEVRDLAGLKEQLFDVVAEHGHHFVSFDRITPQYFLLECRDVQVLLALGNDTLPIDGFLNAARPANSDLAQDEFLNLLTQVRSSTTVIVLPHPEAKLPDDLSDTSDAMCDLCWGVLECLFNHTNADLVFWCDTETLYSAADFDQACQAALEIAAETKEPPQAAATLAVSAPHFAQPPELGDDVRDWFEGGNAQKDALPEDSVFSAAVQRLTSAAYSKGREFAKRAYTASFF